MKGIRFYEEFETARDKRARQSTGNVLAVIAENGVFMSGRIACYEAVGAVYYWPNSACASTSVAVDILRARFRRISEEQARALHPRLFDYLDFSEEETSG